MTRFLFVFAVCFFSIGCSTAGLRTPAATGERVVKGEVLKYRCGVFKAPSGELIVGISAPEIVVADVDGVSGKYVKTSVIYPGAKPDYQLLTEYQEIPERGLVQYRYESAAFFVDETVDVKEDGFPPSAIIFYRNGAKTLAKDLTSAFCLVPEDGS